MAAKLEKGELLEECLRHFFLFFGHFAARSIKVYIGNDDVTDVDVWLYTKGAGLQRTRVLVDAKNKGRPQAMERIVWITGAQKVFGAESTIVASTDTRKEARKFAEDNGVKFFDGFFCKKIMSRFSDFSERMVEEEFWALIGENTLSKLDGDWAGSLRKAKSLLVTDLGYGAINHWLSDCHFFAEKAVLRTAHSQTAVRCFYLLLSYLCIGLDYAMRDCAFEENEDKKPIVANGLKYGAGGYSSFNDKLQLAVDLVRASLPDSSHIERAIKATVAGSLTSAREDIISEYVTRSDVQKSLFSLAREFEMAAMRRNFTAPSALPTPLQSFIGCILDATGLGRVAFFGADFDA